MLLDRFAFEDVLGLLHFIIYIVQYPQYKAHEGSSTTSNEIIQKPRSLNTRNNLQSHELCI